MEWEDYIIGDTNVLKNKLGITDRFELQKKETEIVVSKLAYLYMRGMKGNFDQNHLCAIHKFLFEDIYEFAGKFREVDIFKDSDAFVHYEDIEKSLYDLFNEMNHKEVNVNNKFEIAKYLADYYYKLIEVHPFREGNGRSTREFMRQLVLKKFGDYELDYTKINKKNFKLGYIERKQYPLLIAYEFYNGLVEKNQIDKDKMVYHLQ